MHAFSLYRTALRTEIGATGKPVKALDGTCIGKPFAIRPMLSIVVLSLVDMK
jgi:hypothetical protein